ncbi:MAG: hypothetical protein WBD02_09345 [Acidimicrobiia bacterium]
MRKGTTIAIVLLLAAILLAGVLKLVFHIGDPPESGAQGERVVLVIHA